LQGVSYTSDSLISLHSFLLLSSSAKS